MSGYGDIQMSVRGMKAGAVDFLTKPLRHQDVLDAVTAALMRDRTRRLEEAAVNVVRHRYATLTRRECEVIHLVTAGKMNKEMAVALGLSEITVKIHRAAVMKKMNAGSVAELVKMTELLRLADLGPTASPLRGR
jgi:FixJ family two-component response regulator